MVYKNFVMQQFEKDLIVTLEKAGSSKLAVVLDGKYYLYKSKMVYAYLRHRPGDEGPSVSFIVRRKEKPHNVEVRCVKSHIVDKILSDELYDVSLGVKFPYESCKIDIDVDLGLLIIESGIYNAARKIAINKDYRYLKIEINGVQIEDQNLVNKLVRSFKDNAYINFGKMVFSKSSNKFITQIYSKFRFYKTMYGFIPVIIKYPKLYNPFFDDPDNYLDRLYFYQVAKQKNRLVGNEGGLQAYMLTHEEICRAFSMSHFMRFTPSLFYDLLVGLMNPNLDIFPSVSNEVYAKPDNLETVKLPICYSKIKYFSVISKYEENLRENPSDENVKNKLNALKSYAKQDALYTYCKRNLQYFFNYGPSVIDPPHITVDTVYNYLQEMKLNTV